MAVCPEYIPVLSQFLGYFRRFRNISNSGCQHRHFRASVFPSALMEQLGSHWTDFYEF